MINLKSSRMLAILAHPDDESFAIGGPLAKYAHQGIQVVLLTATRGEAGILGTKPEAAGAIRELELNRAAKHLGIEVYFLDYKDGELATVNPEKLLEHIACWIDTVQPQVVLTFGPDGVSGHPDHVAVSKIVTQAVEKFFPNVCLLYIAPSEATALGCGVTATISGKEDKIIPVDISDYKIQKIRAIQSHNSQHPPLEGKAEEEVDKVPCHEYFTIAQSMNNARDLMDCFDIAEDRM
jgi:LmbE family N-acetylglucosaminyl deacetylase